MDSQEKKAAILKDTLVYSAANYVVQILGIVTSIAMRRYTGPEAMGVWSILQVILGYCGYASFGATKALARDYPMLRAKGEMDKAQRLCNVTLTFSMIMSIIPSAGILTYLIVNHATIEKPFMVGLVFISVFLFLQRFYDLIMTLLRSEKKFGVLSQLIILNAVGTLAITFLFIRQWQLYGLLFGTLCVTLLCLAFIYYKSPFKFQFYWNWEDLKKELQLGIPLVIISWGAEFLKSLDKLILAKRLGFYEVGLYSLATMANSYVFAMPMMFAHVWYPNLQEAYGTQADPEKIKNYLLKPIFILSILIPFLSSFAIFGIQVVGHYFIPKFLPGMDAVKIYLCGTFFILMAQFSGNFLVTIDEYWINVPVLIFSIGVNYFLNQTVLNWNWGLNGVAGGTGISFAVYGLTLYFIAMTHFAPLKDIIKNMLGPLAQLTLLFAAIFLLDTYINPANILLAASLKTVLFMIIMVPFLFLLDKKTGLVHTSWNLIAQKFKKKSA